MSNENYEEKEMKNSINDDIDMINIQETEKMNEIDNEEIKEENKVEDKTINEEEKIPNQEKSQKTSPLIIKKNIKSKRNIEIIRPFRNSYNPGNENTIYEDPENDTMNDFEDMTLKWTDIIKNKFKVGTLYHTVLILFINSPVIIVLYVVYIFAKSLACGCIGLFLACIFSYYTTIIILNLKIKTSNDKIKDILKNNIKNWVYYIYIICDFFDNFGIGFINVNIAFYSIQRFNKYLFPNNENKYIQSGIVLFLQLIMSIIRKNIKNVINLFLFILFQIIFIYIMIKGENNGESFKFNFFDKIELFFIFFPILFLCMANHTIFLDECKNMKRFTLNRGKKVIVITIILQFILYFINGIFLSFKVFDDKLNNNPIYWLIDENKKDFANDIFMLIILLIFIFCSFNSNIYLRISINNNFYEGDIKEKIVFYFLIIIYNVLNCLLIDNSKFLLYIISITSFFSLMICYIIPIYTYLNILKSISKFRFIINSFIAICFFLLGILQLISLFILEL